MTELSSVTWAALQSVADELELTFTKSTDPDLIKKALRKKAVPEAVSRMSPFAVQVLRDMGVLESPKRSIRADCFGCYYESRNEHCQQCRVSVRCAQVQGRPILSARIQSGRTRYRKYVEASQVRRQEPAILEKAEVKAPSATKEIRALYKDAHDQLVGQLYDNGYNEKNKRWRKVGPADEFTLDHGIITLRNWATTCRIWINDPPDGWVQEWGVTKGQWGHEWSDPDIDRTLEMINSLLDGLAIGRSKA